MLTLMSGAVEEFRAAVDEFTGAVRMEACKLLLVDRTMTSTFFIFSWPENTIRAKSKSGIVKTKDKLWSLHLNFISLQICFVWKAKLTTLIR